LDPRSRVIIIRDDNDPSREEGFPMPYVHAVPGRLRIKARSLATENRAVRAACHALMAIPGIEDVTHKTRVSSVIVLHDPKLVSAETIMEVFRDRGLVPEDLAPAMHVNALPARPDRPAGFLPSGAAGALATSALTNSALTMVGGAVGKALFGAVIKTSLERGVATLVTAAIR